MATAAVTASYPSQNPTRQSTYTYGSMANGDVGAQVDASRIIGASLFVTGTFGAGGSVALQGSNDGTNWTALRNSAGVVIAITALGLDVATQFPVRFIRPAVTAGDGTTALICVIVASTPSV